MKKLMLLGGSKYLIPVIKKAHILGIYVITCDYLPDNIAHKYSDEYLNISIVDKDAVLAAAIDNNIDGIMSFATDPGVVTAAYIAEKLDLPFAGSYESVSILQNKNLFRGFLKNNNFNVPTYGSYNNYSQALEDIKKFEFPVIVKPVDSAGSKGVSKIDSLDDLRLAVETALDFSISDEIIIEEFIEKEGFSSDSDCFSFNGQFSFISFSDQRFDDAAINPYTPSAYSWPSTMKIDAQCTLKSEIQRLADLLNLKTSIYNVETRLGKNGKTYIMEVSPRGGGNRLSEMLERITGVDIISNAILNAVGLPCKKLPEPKYNGYLAEVILHSKCDGIFKTLDIDECIVNNIKEVDLWIKAGDDVKAFNGANAAIGTVVLAFDNQSKLEKILDDINKYIKVIVE